MTVASLVISKATEQCDKFWEVMLIQFISNRTDNCLFESGCT